MFFFKNFSLPLFLTYFRILGSFIFFLIAAFFFDSFNGSFGLMIAFILLSLTDFLDGFSARYLNQTSRLGSILDPLADKLLVLGSLILFTWHHIIPVWFSFLLIARDTLVSSLREYAIEQKIRIMPSWLAKIKTAGLMIFIAFLYSYPCSFDFQLIYFLLSFFSIISAAGYIAILKEGK